MSVEFEKLQSGTLGSRELYNENLDKTKASLSRSGVQYFNTLRDAGRLAIRTSNDALLIDDVVNSNSFATPYNGALFSSAGKFINDNNDAGGSRGSMTADALKLLSDMGQAGARHGQEYHILNIVAGSGTGSSNHGKYGVLLIASQASRAIGGGAHTFSCWLRNVSGGVNVKAPCYVDGVYYAAGVDTSGLFDDNGFHFCVSSITGASNGYENLLRIHATPSANIQIALPAIFAGEVVPDSYLWPIWPAYDDVPHNNSSSAHVGVISAAIDANNITRVGPLEAAQLKRISDNQSGAVSESTLVDWVKNNGVTFSIHMTISSGVPWASRTTEEQNILLAMGYSSGTQHFQDPSAFNVVKVSWTGMTPGGYLFHQGGVGFKEYLVSACYAMILSGDADGWMFENAVLGEWRACGNIVPPSPNPGAYSYSHPYARSENGEVLFVLPTFLRSPVAIDVTTIRTLGWLKAMHKSGGVVKAVGDY